MIIVGGFNPAIDRLIDVDALEPGRVLRARSARALPGGKGVHVALTVAALGEPVTLVAPIDGAHRERFAAFLGVRGVALDAVPIAGEPRTCLAIRDRAGAMTEILEPGPELAADEAAALRARFEALAARASVAVLAGSVPPGLDAGTYATLVAALPGVRTIVDASGEALRRALAARPFALKPNREEAEALLGTTLAARADVERAVLALAAAGIELPVVSLGAEGAVAAWRGRVARAALPPRPVDNAVGSGDCLVGGLAVALARGLGPEETLRLAVACGTANALTSETGLVRRADVEALVGDVTVRWRP
jgi:tagatose 6-phosphate kinase